MGRSSITGRSNMIATLLTTCCYTRIVLLSHLQERSMPKIHHEHQGIECCRLRITTSVWWLSASKQVEDPLDHLPFVASSKQCIKKQLSQYCRMSRASARVYIGCWKLRSSNACKKLGGQGEAGSGFCQSCHLGRLRSWNRSWRRRSTGEIEG
jgi:hypothetical protein